MISPTPTHDIGSIFEKAILSGSWELFKHIWWLIPLVIIIKIFLVWLDRKTDKWKRRTK